MTIIPAIDLLDGEVVRLYKGDYNEKKVYHNVPLEQARTFSKAGFERLHIVDLNGAKSGSFENLPHTIQIIEELGVSVQTGGGIRSFDDVSRLIDAGVSRVICSSMAVKRPDEWLRALDRYPGQCILGLDLKDGKMSYGGWLETDDRSISDMVKPMIDAGLREVLSTDISRDGTLAGPNVELYRTMKEEFPDLDWIASGGVSSMQDLEELKGLGMSAAIVGKAYYEGNVTLEELAAF